MWRDKFVSGRKILDKSDINVCDKSVSEKAGFQSSPG